MTDKLERSLGLIVLGILFLAGGWMLEMSRRRLMAHITQGRRARSLESRRLTPHLGSGCDPAAERGDSGAVYPQGTPLPPLG